jgi:hypothetical protein
MTMGRGGHVHTGRLLVTWQLALADVVVEVDVVGSGLRGLVFTASLAWPAIWWGSH